MKMRNKAAPCGRCKHPEFEVSSATDGRPRFKCTNCGDTWTCGKDGGKYLSGARPCAKR